MRARPAMAAMTAMAAALGIAPARPAVADPTGSRVLTAPTAWLLEAGAASATLGLDHRGDGSVRLAYGLGGIAELELGGDSDVRGCTDCTVRPVPLVLGRAAFRIGAHQDAWIAGMPAIALGVRTAFAARGHELHE